MAEESEIKMEDLTFGENEVIKPRKEKEGNGKSPRYKGPDKLAMKKGLSEKQKVFVDHYLKTMNATESYRASKGILDKPELWSPGDAGNGRLTKSSDKIKQYLNEKILSEADELLDIQMDIIRNEKMPPAVRNDAIKDRLNRIGVGREKDDGSEYTGIGEVTITIKHKKPTIIEGEEVVEVLDGEDNNG